MPHTLEVSNAHVPLHPPPTALPLQDSISGWIPLPLSRAPFLWVHLLL